MVNCDEITFGFGKAIQFAIKNKHFKVQTVQYKMFNRLDIWFKLIK